MTDEPRKVNAAKVALRRELRVRLAGLAPDAARRAAEEIARRALALPEVAEAGSVLVCLSFGSELDTWGLVERLLASGKRVYVPRADPRDRRLHLHRYPCGLETLSFGLRQPPRPAPGTEPDLPDEGIDMEIGAVFVLGLGFDRRGIRLGYGGGYFDRFFGEHRVPAIGLAYGVQIVDRLPTEPHDVPMTVVVTEDEVIRP
jgi:5-formyltetrahydrofolate cyclo-ligase